MKNELGLSVRVTTVEPGSDALRQVIALGDRNTHFLGHFPESAFQREAAKGRILAAILDDNSVGGYVMYRIARNRAVVQHICVDSSLYRNGIGRALIEALKQRTCHLPEIICHVAREFQSSVAAWQRFGFVPMGEKPGRGRTRRPLLRMVFDHNHPHLFTDRRDSRALETLVAALDLNVALALHDDASDDPEILSLKREWLLEEVSLWITDESMTEVTRQEDLGERTRSTAELRCMDALDRNLERENTLQSILLRLMFGSSHRPQNISDARQVAQAIAGDADVFLTRDEGILRHADKIEEQFDLRIMRPSDLVLQLDELARAADYAPVRLHGSDISVRPVSSGDLDAVIDQFLNSGDGEQRHRLARVVRGYVSSPAHSQVLVIESGGSGFRAVIGFSWGSSSGDDLRVGLLRVKKDRLGETLTRHMLAYAVRESLRRGCALTIIDDPHPICPIDGASTQLGFIAGQGTVVKWSGRRLLSRGQLLDEIRSSIDIDPVQREPLTKIVSEMQRESSAPEDDQLLERLTWPALLRSSTLRTFVVPIQPRFAVHLFDSVLSGAMLFGGDPSLLLNCENVYYRSSHVPVIAAPARILWYVSKDVCDTVQELRAISSVLTTEVGSAKRLYGSFKRLGVYRWSDVAEIADGDPAGEVMAVRFGLTEMLARPIRGERLRELIAEYRGSSGPPPLSMPVEIPAACFERIIEIANGM